MFLLQTEYTNSSSLTISSTSVTKSRSNSSSDISWSEVVELVSYSENIGFKFDMWIIKVISYLNLPSGSMSLYHLLNTSFAASTAVSSLTPVEALPDSCQPCPAGHTVQVLQAANTDLIPNYSRMNIF